MCIGQYCVHKSLVKFPNRFLPQPHLAEAKCEELKQVVSPPWTQLLAEPTANFNVPKKSQSLLRATPYNMIALQAIP